MSLCIRDGVKGHHAHVYTPCEKYHSKDVSMSGFFIISIRLISMAVFSHSVHAVPLLVCAGCHTSCYGCHAGADRGSVVKRGGWQLTKSIVCHSGTCLRSLSGSCLRLIGPSGNLHSRECLYMGIYCTVIRGSGSTQAILRTVAYACLETSYFME